MAENLLEVNNLKTYFFSRAGVVKAVDDVSFTIKPSETLGVVGESGCGKSVTALSVMRLVASPPGKIVGGEIIFNGDNVMDKNMDELTELRGSKISMIFQDPMTSLNPVYTVGYQIAETVKRHRKDMSKDQAWKRAVEMLDLVRIPDAKPHDLGVVAGTCEYVNVMYAGHIVESAPVKQIFETPAHPYTVGLLHSMPRLDDQRGVKLSPIAGQPPDLLNPPAGCPYAPRCPKVQERCRRERPELMPVGRGEQVAACFYPD